MTLIEDAKQVLLRAWSVRLALLSTTFACTEAMLPSLTSLLPPKTMALLAAVSACGTVVARVVAQPATLPGKS